jgi:hypothetical protein
MKLELFGRVHPELAFLEGMPDTLVGDALTVFNQAVGIVAPYGFGKFPIRYQVVRRLREIARRPLLGRA